MSATELTKTRAGAVWQGARHTWVNTTSCEAGLDRLMAGAGGAEQLPACRTGPGNMGVNSVLTHEKRETSCARRLASVWHVDEVGLVTYRCDRLGKGYGLKALPSMEIDRSRESA